MIRALLAYLRGHLWLRRRARMSPEEQTAAILAHLEEHRRLVDRDKAMWAQLGEGLKATCEVCGWSSADVQVVLAGICPRCNGIDPQVAAHVAALRRIS